MACINECVKVVAVFDKGVKPVKFKWRSRLYEVREITYTWNSKEDGANVMHFAVSDGSTLYELSYNQSTLKWSVKL